MTDCSVVARMQAGLGLTGCWHFIYSVAKSIRWLSLAGETPQRDNNGKETMAPVKPPVHKVNRYCLQSSIWVLVWRCAVQHV